MSVATDIAQKATMKRAAGLVVVVCALLSGCVTNDLKAPFQTTLTAMGGGRFRYVAASSARDPAQSRDGERLRLEFLEHYFSAHNLCRKGFDVVYRTTISQIKPRRWEDEETDGWVSYIIQCRPSKSAGRHA